MPPVDRNNPQRAKSSDSQYSLMEFMREFPDDAACIEWLWHTRCSEDGEHAHCPKCDELRAFKRYATKQRRQSWTCTTCGHHVQPTAGTIFEGSATSLHLWFYAIHLMTSTRCGLSAKQLEREIGVTYKTAWRMLNLIRNDLMPQDDDETFTGEVELDETYVGGKPRSNRAERVGRPGGDSRKVPVFGMVERGGAIRATVVPDARRNTLADELGDRVLPDSMIFTDEYKSYTAIGRNYRAHHRIRHKAGVYVDGNVHTNTIEGFFGLMKNSIRGTHHAVSAKWLQSYLDEYVWRYNHRHDNRSMFRLLLLRAAAGS